MVGAGRPPGSKGPKLFKDALTIAVKRVEGDKTRLAMIADVLVEKACQGDVAAAREVMDRIDGRVAQPIEGEIDVAHYIARLPSPGQDIGQWQERQNKALLTQQ